MFGDGPSATTNDERMKFALYCVVVLEHIITHPFSSELAIISDDCVKSDDRESLRSKEFFVAKRAHRLL